MSAPEKITIIGHPWQRNQFTVIAQHWCGELEIADGLTYDEMLGSIARATCPAMSNGDPVRKLGQPLFLAPPKKT